MSQVQSFSKKTFAGILFITLLFTAVFDASVYYGFHTFFVNDVMSRDIFINHFLPVSVGLWLCFTIIVWLFVKSSAKTIVAGETDKPEKETKTEDQALLDANRNKRFFLHLLSVLQRDARLVDFFFEKLDQFEDAQIGAAVRNIHENSFKTMTKYVSPKPVIDNDEGDVVTIDKGFDPASVKLTGNVTGEPPFKGVLRHKGWQAEAIELPVLSDRENSLLIAPAEVEIQ